MGNTPTLFCLGDFPGSSPLQLHPSEWEGIAVVPGVPRNHLGISSSFFREQSFLCAAGDTGEQGWVQVPKGQCRWSSPVIPVWIEQNYTDGAYGPSGAPTPTPPSSSQRVKCNDLFKVNPFHLHQFGAYPSTACLPLCQSCLVHKLNLRGKALG
ncbi:LOW QUALITY PROTEIN: TGFB1-induced anti-apoptotic factor 1 [Carlito syrichta]|uniref:LOW QUALITY PROTEIN: TGFB1-induced anti-apoptotic factor 1 n=1 Tax=Carlito syrichta TaxID=1868482 RepID=A0A1U7UAU5_CARSF|nr:LOW QUALITY PROTEIN: TGFB1-induced anti-apoptotic factor 1 [Carlito syrichta]